VRGRDFWTMTRDKELHSFQSSSSLHLGDMMLTDTDYFVVDIETSGFSATTDMVLSLAAGKIAAGTLDFELEQYNLVQHTDTSEVREVIWKLTGLSPNQIKMEGRPWKDVLLRALQLSENRVWIAHHARHELSFLQRHARLYWRMQLRPIMIDTAVVAQALCRLPAPPTLDAVCDWLSVPVTRRHCAADDVEMTAAVWNREMEYCRAHGLRTVREVVDWSISWALG